MTPDTVTHTVFCRVTLYPTLFSSFFCSYVYSPTHIELFTKERESDVDEQLVVELFERTAEDNDEIGLTGMAVEGYETGQAEYVAEMERRAAAGEAVPLTSSYGGADGGGEGKATAEEANQALPWKEQAKARSMKQDGLKAQVLGAAGYTAGKTRVGSDCDTNPHVFFEVSVGGVACAERIVIELRADIVPATVANFLALCGVDFGNTPGGAPTMGVANGAFAGSIFHRIIPDFMAQGGDFTNADGTGGASIYGAQFDDENFLLRHDAVRFSYQLVPIYYLLYSSVV